MKSSSILVFFAFYLALVLASWRTNQIGNIIFPVDGDKDDTSSLLRRMSLGRSATLQLVEPREHVDHRKRYTSQPKIINNKIYLCYGHKNRDPDSPIKLLVAILVELSDEMARQLDSGQTPQVLKTMGEDLAKHIGDSMYSNAPGWLEFSRPVNLAYRERMRAIVGAELQFTRSVPLQSLDLNKFMSLPRLLRQFYGRPDIKLEFRKVSNPFISEARLSSKVKNRAPIAGQEGDQV